MAIQDGFEARAADGASLDGASPDLRVRIGIAAGEPVDRDEDLFGSTVTLASRICAAADAGHILTSELVEELGRERGFDFDGEREIELKGFPAPTRVFELVRTSRPDRPR
jgi:class 3 adenylate cyclase